MQLREYLHVPFLQMKKVKIVKILYFWLNSEQTISLIDKTLNFCPQKSIACVLITFNVTST